MSDSNPKKRVSLQHLRGKMDHHMIPVEHKEEHKAKQKSEKLSLSSLKPKYAKTRIDQQHHRVSDEVKSKQIDFKIKDSIEFRKSTDYEAYLMDCLENYDLSWELYDKFKILYGSAKDFAGLHRVWKRLGDLGLSECRQWLEIAEVMRQMGEMEMAKDYLEKNVRVHPDDPDAVYAMAIFYKLQRDYELSIHWLKKWQRLEQQNPQVYYHLGVIYKRINSFDLARQNLLECLRLDHNHALAKALLEKIQ